VNIYHIREPQNGSVHLIFKEGIFRDVSIKNC